MENPAEIIHLLGGPLYLPEVIKCAPEIANSILKKIELSISNGTTIAAKFQE
jgi:hypothetical protein